MSLISPLPCGANALDLLWTYLVTVDGTKKDRCVCHGQPKFMGTVIFRYTFAKMLAHVGSHIFGGTVASKASLYEASMHQAYLFMYK